MKMVCLNASFACVAFHAECSSYLSYNLDFKLCDSVKYVVDFCVEANTNEGKDDAVEIYHKNDGK